MTSSRLKIVGWTLSILLFALFAFVSAPGKLVEFEGRAEMFEKLGYSESVMFKIGIVEVTLAILFLIPRTAFIGAILLTGYLGGATATHVRVGESFLMPIVVGIVMWVALGLRQTGIFQLAFGSPRPESTAPSANFSERNNT